MRKYFFALFLILIIAGNTSNLIAQDRIDLKMYPTLKQNLNENVALIESRDFTTLMGVLPENSKIRWIECGPNDLDPVYYKKDAMIAMLVKDSTDAKIKVYKDPQVVDPMKKDKEYVTVLFTQGWSLPNSFRAFSFSSIDKKKWKLWGVCFDNKPPYDELTGSR